MNKTFRRIDLWVGRHMSAKRWIAVYYSMGVIGGVLLRYGWQQDQGWLTILGVIFVFVGALGIHGNARRLK